MMKGNNIKRDTGSTIFYILMRLATLFTFAVLFFLIGYILLRGVSSLSPSIFQWQYTTQNVSMTPAIVTTIIIVGLSILIAAPIGVFTGFYLVEYASKGSKVVELIRISSETLAAIPSIVYGLFGMLFFGIFLNFGYSIVSGVLTVSIMILPLIIRSTEEALISVSDSLRNGSFALGAGKLRTIFKVVLPTAMPGVVSGVILAIGRVIGETAALIYTLGTSTNMPKNLMSSGRTLALHMYVLSNEGLHVNEAFATGVILLVVVIILNQLSVWLSDKLTGV
ncbi:MAG: phosphate ABC transporter permease PstA [Neofamilia sp.]